MPRGESGRMVVEIDPEKKRALYSLLDRRGLTFKAWLLERIDRYLEEAQLSLFDENGEVSDA